MIKKLTQKQRDNKLYKAHIRRLYKVFGKKKGDVANIGWVTDEDALTSKIYQPDHFGFITTTISTKGKIRHFIKK